MIAEKIEVEGFVSEYRYVEDEGVYDKIFYPVTGFFVMTEGDPYSMKLYDATGRFLHSMDRVSLARSVFNSLEGDIRFPRPFVFRYKDDAEKKTGKFPSVIISHGEHLVISYIEGNIRKPIVMYSVESFAFQNQIPFLRTDPLNLERKAKRYENDNYVLEFEDDGSGNLTLMIHSKKSGNGNISIKTNGNIVIDDGEKGAARLDDQVQVTAQIGDISVDPSTHHNTSPITITGKITAASTKVKIG
jgi:hypothetical protein